MKTILSILCALLILCTSCHTESRLAKRCAAKFPIKDSIIEKTTTQYDTVEINAPVYIYDTLTVAGQPVLLEKKCPPSKVITKTEWKEKVIFQRDRAYEQVQSDSIQHQLKINKDLTTLNNDILKQNQQLITKVEKWHRRFFFILALFGVLALFLLSKLFK